MRSLAVLATAICAAVTLAAPAAAAPSTQDWGLDRIDQRKLPLDGAAFRPAQTGSGVNIYVVDTGIRASHQAFGGRVRSAHDSTGQGGGTRDCYSHGTSVASIAARVATTATIQAVRAVCGNAPDTSIRDALNWIAKNGVRPAVVSISLGLKASPDLDAATKAVLAAGIPVMASAGNEGVDACGSSPARVPGAITVGATDRTDKAGSFSNTGTCVDVLAPGVDIPVATSDSDTSTDLSTGTSEAAPYVAGAAALYLSAHPKASVAEVTAAIKDTATTGALRDIGKGTPNKLLFVGR